MTVSKRLRFEILRRDNHCCRYCGARGPDVPLRVDHVVPVALGGSDDPSNLVTACEPCNTGKSSVPADAPLVADVAADAMRWAAAMLQAAGEFAAAAAGHPELYAAVDAEWYRGTRPDDWMDSIDHFIKAGLPPSVIVKMAEVAQNKRGSMGHRWSYFCGCCWTRIRQMQDRAAEIVGQGSDPAPAETVMSTKWTKEEIEARLTEAMSLADSRLGDETIGCVACRHVDSGHCGDPVCITEYATSLEWLAIYATEPANG